jgi:hypothetical protein
MEQKKEGVMGRRKRRILLSTCMCDLLLLFRVQTRNISTEANVMIPTQKSY